MVLLLFLCYVRFSNLSLKPAWFVAFLVEVISDICGMLIAALTPNFEREKMLKWSKCFYVLKYFPTETFSAT